jgi:hypothetical protein
VTGNLSFLKKRPGLVFEWAMAVFTLGTVIHAVIFLSINKSLPQPFFYAAEDLLGDWFNTAYWARDKGTYDVWTTLYPPLTFVFMRLVGIDSCYLPGRAYDPSPGYPARDCDWLGHVSIWALFLLNFVLIYLVFRRIDKSTAIPRAICLALGWPMLDGLERGNLVLAAFPCFLLAFTPLLRSARLKWLFAGLAVNFKVYLIGGIVALLLKRKWLWVECALIATAAIYLITYAILGRGTPVEIYHDLANWDAQDTTDPLHLWVATTYQQLLSLAKGDYFPSVIVLGSRPVDLIILIVPIVVRFTQLLILAAAATVWLRPEAVANTRVVTLAVMLALITSESGGYTPTFFMLLVLMEPWRGAGRKVAIIGCYLLAPSIDFPISEVPPVVTNTWLGNRTVFVTYYVGIAPFLRPAVILIIAQAIASATIADVWRDIRQQGWSGRWRFRRDVPFLPWIKHPLPPASALIAPAGPKG